MSEPIAPPLAMAIILHLDFNSYFASVEQQANPFLRGLPMAVTGKGRQAIDVAMSKRQANRIQLDQLTFQRSVITTASREAKAKGVATAMGTWQAKKILPSLIIVPGDPFKYGEITQRFMNILRRHADAVEQFSTDEAFADISTASGGDYFGSVFLAQNIRAEIAKECGGWCTVSIGIASNKFLAKLASESCKPHGLTCIRPNEAEDFVLTRKLEDFCGIGKNIQRRLETLGATSVTTLRRLPLSVLIQEFKSYGHFLYAAARGQGSDKLNDLQPPKSIGNSYTFPSDLTSSDEVYANLLALADRVAWRMRKHRLSATQVAGYIHYAKFDGLGLNRRVNDHLHDGLKIANTIWPELEAKLDFNRGVRLIGISVSGLAPEQNQDSLFVRDQKQIRATIALDALTKKYGNGAWQRAATMKTLFKERVSGWHYDHEN